jgi:hypothetical protein
MIVIVLMIRGRLDDAFCQWDSSYTSELHAAVSDVDEASRLSELNVLFSLVPYSMQLGRKVHTWDGPMLPVCSTSGMKPLVSNQT